MAVIYDRTTGRYYGMAAEAKRLGVTLPHLSQVLRGIRDSKSLKRRIRIKETGSEKPMSHKHSLTTANG
jgi:hypothetical protein